LRRVAYLTTSIENYLADARPIADTTAFKTTDQSQV